MLNVASLVSFNYLGQLDPNENSIFGNAPETLQKFVGSTCVSQENSPYRLLEVNCGVRNGKLNFSCEYVIFLRVINA